MLDPNDVGAWVLKGNPENEWSYYDARKDAGVKAGERVSAEWSLGKTGRNDLMEDGDLVVIYMGGRAAEVVEIGVVNDVDSQGTWDRRYTINATKVNKIQRFRGYDGVRLSQSIPRAALKANPDIAQSEFIRAAQISNPTYLTPEETRALAGMISKRDLQAAGWAGDKVFKP